MFDSVFTARQKAARLLECNLRIAQLEIALLADPLNGDLAARLRGRKVERRSLDPRYRSDTGGWR